MLVASGVAERIKTWNLSILEKSVKSLSCIDV